MDARRQPDEMTDAALDRELQAMLGVDPSPEFAARVRTRIADEPVQSGSWFSLWRFAVPIAALAAIAIIAVIGRDTRRARSDVRPPEMRVTNSEAGRNAESANAAPRPPAAQTGRAESPATTVATHHPTAEGKPAPQVRGAETVTSSNAAAARREPAEPEVLVDPREAAALLVLVRGARDGRIDLAPVAAAAEPAVMELPPVVDIEIPAITIDPIAPAAGEEGVRQ